MRVLKSQFATYLQPQDKPISSLRIKFWLTQDKMKNKDTEINFSQSYFFKQYVFYFY